MRTTEFGLLLLSGPALACEVPPGYRAFVVGVVAGRVTAGGDELACLVGCYVVPILDSLPRTD